MKTIVAHEQQAVQQQLRPWRLVHDLRHGRRACDIRIGDYILLESGLYEVRGGDGRTRRHLWVVQEGAS